MKIYATTYIPKHKCMQTGAIIMVKSCTKGLPLDMGEEE